MRRLWWVRYLILPKPSTYTEAIDVYAAGISGKVARITLGDLLLCLRLLML